jgi:large subunit ribosomal protein L10
MPNQKNITTVQEIGEHLSKAKAVILADYAGLDVATQTDLRAKVAEVGGTFTVTKNRLFKLAFNNTRGDLSDVIDTALEGPNAVLYGFDDAVSATKALVDFAKDHEALVIKVGILTGLDGQPDQILSLGQINSLASLPSRDQLLAQLTGQLNAPIAGFVNVLSGNLKGLVQVLKAVQEKRAN